MADEIEDDELFDTDAEDAEFVGVDDPSEDDDDDGEEPAVSIAADADGDNDDNEGSIQDNEIFDLDAEQEAPVEPEPEPDVDEDDKAGADAPGEDSYGKKVTDRINRITGTHKQELAQKDRELAALREKVSANDTAAAEASITALESEHETLLKDLQGAKEDGESEREVEISDRLMDVKIGLRDARASKPSADRPVTAPESAPAKLSTEDVLNSFTPIAREWAVETEFMGLSDEDRGRIIAIDANLDREGMDKETPEYFVELTRRINASHPNMLGKKPGKDPKKERSRNNKNLSSSVSGGSANPPRATGGKTNSVTLSKIDLANMKKFGLNTLDPAVLKAYAASIRQEG